VCTKSKIFSKKCETEMIGYCYFVHGLSLKIELYVKWYKTYFIGCWV